MKRSKVSLARTLLAILSLVFMSVALWAQDNETSTPSHDTTAKKVITVEGITEYELSNGLRVILLPDPASKNITVNITYLVGSADEGYGETGMAHLLEHLIFKGSTNHPNIPQELTERGSAPNGSTWLDRTNYYETFAATDDNLDWALDLEADRMINCFISEEDLAPEMPVVRNEWEIGENRPGSVLSKRVRAVAFDWHNYANSTIGAKADIENVPIERLRGFYKKYYQPDNAVLLIAGKIDEQATIDLVLEKFGPIPRPDRTGTMEIFPNYTHEPAQDGERTVTLERVGDSQMVAYAYHIPGIASEDMPALEALSFILSGAGFNSRFYKNIIEKELAVNAYAYPDQFRFPGLFWIFATVPLDKSVADVEVAIEQSIDELKTNPPSEEEIERAKTSFSNFYKNAMNNVHGMASRFSELSGNGDWKLFFADRERAKDITAAQVQAVAKKYLISSNRTKGYFKPVDDTPPRVVTANTLPEDLVTRYEYTEEVDTGEVFEYSFDNIAARTEFRTLSNGTRVAFLTKENKGDTVSLNATMRWGTLEAVMDKGTIASFTGALLNRGTNQHTKEELADKRTALRLNGGVNVGLTSGGVFASTIRENLVDSIRLVAEVAKDPAFPADELELIRENSIAGLIESRSEPNTLASIAINKHFSPYPKGHPFYVEDIDESIEAVNSVTLDEIKAFYNDFVGFGPNTTITVIGDFDADEVFAVLEEEFGNWVSKANYERIDRDAFIADGEEIEIHTPDKTSALLVARFEFESTDESPDYEAITLAGTLLGGGFLNSRLATRIRQQEGLSYSVGGGFGGSNPIDNRRVAWASATVNPEDMDRLVTAFKEEIIRAVEEGFTQEEVSAGLEGLLDSRKRSRTSDGWISGVLHHNMFWGRDMAFHKAQDERYEALTVDAVNTAFQDRVSLDKYTIVTAGDMSKKVAAEDDAGE